VTLSPSGGARVSVRFWSRDGRPFKVTKVTASNPAIVAELPVRAAKFQEVWLSVKEPAKKGQFESGHLDIFTAEYPNEPYRVELVILP
jgi:hypothetical protein